MITQNVALVSSDDRANLWFRTEEAGGGPDKTTDGAIFELDLSTKPAGVKKLEMIGWPEDVAFHPHGIYFLKEKNLLFAVSHAYGKGGERIEVFKYSNSALTYQFSLRNEEFFDKNAMGALNDLVVVKDGELYVTNYLVFPDDPIRGKLDHKYDAFSKIKRFAGVVAQAAG